MIPTCIESIKAMIVETDSTRVLGKNNALLSSEIGLTNDKYCDIFRYTTETHV